MDDREWQRYRSGMWGLTAWLSAFGVVAMVFATLLAVMR